MKKSFTEEEGRNDGGGGGFFPVFVASPLRILKISSLKDFFFSRKQAFQLHLSMQG
jgi:hypothetical protein